MATTEHLYFSVSSCTSNAN